MNDFEGGCKNCAHCSCQDKKGDSAPITDSVWMRTRPEAASYLPLRGAVTADVCIIGGGITGVTAAYLLAKAGKRVVLLEMAKLGSGVTGYTTAHLTVALDISYQDLIKHFGLERATQIASDSARSIAKIRQLIEELTIDCDFSVVPGFLYAARPQQRSIVRDEAGALKKVGIDSSYSDETPLPFTTYGSVQISDQAQLHPLKYLQAVAAAAQEAGVEIHEATTVKEIEHDSRVVTDQGVVQASHIIMATHTPITKRLLPVQSKLEPSRSYVIGVRLEENSPVPAGLFWDLDEPYHYLRTVKDAKGDVLIIGGEDHRTGEKTDTDEATDQLIQYACKRFPVASVDYTWSAQVFNPVDMVPYIGRAPFSRRTLIATGYSGNGLTFGTLSALILTEQIMGVKKTEHAVYRPGRITLAGTKALFQGGVVNARHFILDRLRPAAGSNADDVELNSGAIIRRGASKVAVYKDAQGNVTTLSPICPHAGCIVQWNNGARSWDCPCHGSRFTATGELITGPATTGLQKL